MRCHDTSRLSLPCFQVHTYLQKMKAFYSLNVVCFLFIDSINVDYYEADTLCDVGSIEVSKTDLVLLNIKFVIQWDKQVITDYQECCECVCKSKNHRKCEIGRAGLCAEKSRHGNTGEKKVNQWLRPCAGRRRILSMGGVIVLWKGSRREQWVQMLLNL